MALSYPKLLLPDAEETIAFRAVDSILRTDPTLKRILRDYNAWTGDPSDIAAPVPSTCPNLQIAPKPSSSKWETEGMHAMPFTVAITAAVNGSNCDQLMNLWGAVRRALWPSDAVRALAVRTIVVNAGITKPTMLMNAFGVQIQKDGARVLMAQGSLNLYLLVNTP